MPIGRTSFGDDVTDTSSDNPNNYTVGELREYLHGTYGRQVYRYVKLDAGVAAALGQPIRVKNGATTLALTVGVSCVNGTANARVLGVAQQAVLAGYYCWLLCDGKGVFLSDTGGTTADTAQKIITGAAGGFTDGVIGTDELPVVSHETKAAAATFVGTIHAL